MDNTLIALDTLLSASICWIYANGGTSAQFGDWAIYTNGEQTCSLQLSSKDAMRVLVSFCGSRMGGDVQCSGHVSLRQAREIIEGDLHPEDAVAAGPEWA